MSRDQPVPIVLVVSGPNLALLGEREPAVYGTERLSDHVDRARAAAGALGYALEHLHSEHEGELVAGIAAARHRVAAAVVNAGALSHYGWSLHDALASFPGPIVELHLSEPRRREPWRHTSVLAPVADGSISGFGSLGYALAVQAAIDLVERGGGGLASRP